MLIAAIVAMVAFVSSASAAAPAPNYGTGIMVDGNTNDWNLGADFFANMYEAGDPTKNVTSKLYLRYNCNEKVMYALVLEQDPYEAQLSPDDAWIAINTVSNKVVSGSTGDDGVPPDFAWVYDGSDLIGYEASFAIDEGTYKILAHINVAYGGETDRTSATVRDNGQPALDLTISCPITPPPTEEEWMGCTPGYWKNHPDAWVGYSTTDTLGAVFGLGNQFTTVLPTHTLLDALNYRGGSGVEGAAQILMRAATAALLNEDKFGDDYPPYATEQELIDAVMDALNSGDRDTMIELAEQLDYRNNGNCEDD
ncbi:MAG TPA: hypothetical protein HA306_03790 [Methanosarcina sp.]|nr:hypothetical protein [Methanosarcina sp.]